MSLPVFFIALTSATLIAALGALFVSLRAALGGTSGVPLAVGPGLPDRAALEDEKNALLRALKDLEYEHEVGKIADADYERLERAYRMRAKQVLADLDRDLGPYLSQAEELVARSLGEAKPAKGGKKGKKKAKSDEAVVAAPAREESAEPDREAALTPTLSQEEREESASEETVEAEKTLVCAKCATTNDADASFCKRCATPLGPREPEASV